MCYFVFKIRQFALHLFYSWDVEDNGANFSSIKVVQDEKPIKEAEDDPTSWLWFSLSKEQLFKSELCLAGKAMGDFKLTNLILIC